MDVFAMCLQASTLLKGDDFSYTSNELHVDEWDEDNTKFQSNHFSIFSVT